MPYKDKEKQKEYNEQYYKENREKENERFKKYYWENKTNIEKKNLKCFKNSKNIELGNTEILANKLALIQTLWQIIRK
ncbi:hypothetical protein ES707_19145 [subsurface metagenome]